MDPINKLIPADQLHWNEEEGKYSTICKEEVIEIMDKCDQLTIEERVALIMWYQDYKTRKLLWENFMNDRITIGRVKNGEPLFAPIEL